MRFLSCIICGTLLGLSACSSTVFQRPENPVVVEKVVVEKTVPGTYRGPWIEPMRNQVRVPAQLDPSGTYFRPSHNTIVEIRREKFQPLQFPGDRAISEPTGPESADSPASEGEEVSR